MALLYVIGPECGPWKIGISDNPRGRLTELQVGSPIPLRIHHEMLVHDAHGIEKAVHAELEQSRLHGEWFSCPLSDVIGVIRWVMKNLPAATGRAKRNVKVYGGRPLTRVNRLKGLDALAEREWQLREWFGRNGKGTLDF